MADRIISPASWPPEKTLSFSGNILVGPGATVTVDPSWVHYTYSQSGGGAPITDDNVLFTVITASTVGTLLLDGIPTIQFTYQNIVDGRVSFRQDGSSDADNILLFAQVVEAGVAKPYTPHFPYDWSGSALKGAFYAGALLIGPELQSMPIPDGADSSYNESTTDAGIVTLPFSTTQPDEVVFALTYSQFGKLDGPPFPNPNPIASLTYPGLTFTRLGGGTFNYNDFSSGHNIYGTITAELFYALAPTVLSTATATATFTVVPGVGLQTKSFLGMISYYNLADPANPWGTDPASIQTLITNTIPGSLTLNTAADPQAVLPVLFFATAGQEPAVLGPSGTGYLPKGYSIETGGGTGNSEADLIVFTGYSPGYIGVAVDTPIGETLTDSELLFQPQHGFVDLSVAATRQLFVSLSGTPQWMGVSGEIPFAQQPAVYLTTLGPPLDFPQNNGNGGAFVVSGEIDPAAGPGCTPHIITEATGPAQRPQWRLTVSDDGARTWSTLVKPRDIGALGHYKTRLRWLKMGQFRQRVIKLECTDPVRRNVIGIYIDIDQGMAS
jgi:hypothetical protein